MSLDDDIRRTAAGDRAAFTRIVQAFQGRVFGYLGRMGVDTATAEDIAQETFLRVWRHAAQFDPRRAGLATWILTIARNVALSQIESRARRGEMGGLEVDHIACEGHLPDDSLIEAQQAMRLDKALRQLATADRSLLAASYIEGLGLADIARIEGCSVGAVKVRLHRARNRLRTLLESDHDG